MRFIGMLFIRIREAIRSLLQPSYEKKLSEQKKKATNNEIHFT